MIGSFDPAPYFCADCRKYQKTGSSHYCRAFLPKGFTPWFGKEKPDRSPPVGILPNDRIEALTRCGEILNWLAGQVIWWWDAQDEYNDVIAWRLVK